MKLILYCYMQSISYQCYGTYVRGCKLKLLWGELSLAKEASMQLPHLPSALPAASAGNECDICRANLHELRNRN